MTFISNKLNKNCVYEKSNILDVLNVFESTGINLALVINKNKEFVGVISSSDIRRGLIRGLDKSSKIKKIINYSPLYLKDEIDENQLSNLISSPKFNEINPPYIPILDKRNKPRGVIDKQNLNLRFLKRKKKLQVKPRILLLGGAGYIGTSLAENLLKLKYEVTIFDKFVYLPKKKLNDKLKYKNLKLIQGDTRDIEKTFEVLKNKDIVVHLAELVGDPLCEKRPSKTYSTNYLASLGISKICSDLGISKFIYISSCSVYGSRIDEKLSDENSPINPLSVYAKLKALCEKTIIKNSGDFCRPCILRLGTVFGSSLRPRFDLVLNTFAGQIANKKEINIYGGDQWRPFVHVQDVCEVIVKIIKLDRKITNGQIFNIASFNHTLSEVGKKISKIFPKVKINFLLSNLDKRNYRVSTKKAKTILRFKPKYNLEKGIKDLVKFTLENKIKNIKNKKFLNILNAEKF